jgi:transcriptional regulator with XRE-family HTH domain
VKTDPPSVAIAEFPCAVCGARLDLLHVDLGLDGASVCSFCGAPQNERDSIASRASGRDGVQRSFPETTDLLRDARGQRGESLDHVAEVTGIRQTYLEELECGSASFEPYPGRVYGRFFLREYAEYLGLDPGPLVDAFDEEAEGSGIFERTDDAIRAPRRWLGKTLLALGCLAVLLALSAILRGVDRDSSVVGTAYASVSDHRHVQAPHAPAGHAPPNGIRAVATIADRSWIEVLSDGRRIYRATAPAGTVLTFKADRRLELTLGNAGGVALDVNGQPRRTGPTGGVVHLAFELQGDQLRSAKV